MPSEYESLGYAYNLLYDIKTQEQLTNEIDYLVERLSGIAKLCRHDGYPIDDYILMMLNFPKDEASESRLKMENTTIAASPFDIPVGRLLPCPCCGAPASVGFKRTASLSLHGWVSNCTICTDSASFHRFTRAAAVESWNNYASELTKQALAAIDAPGE